MYKKRKEKSAKEKIDQIKVVKGNRNMRGVGRR